ncbi:MAG: TRAP transporter small permease [Deltaproteobacteria bacterium]|nr:TRAP transporter small permease [Deltaproteobacteria bacterium]MBW2305775.1 TRAP transporter small permease [Deltaproteobacteria bacterium]
MDRILTAFEKLLVGSFLLIATLLAFLLVLLRYGFGKGITWGSEAVIILVMWSAFFGAGIAIREKSHIELEVVRDLLPLRYRLPTIVLADVFCLAITLFIFIFGSKMALYLYQSGGINVATELPDWFIFLCVPLGGLTMSIRYLQWLNKHVREMMAYFG